jgi:hypothetical protein
MNERTSGIAAEEALLRTTMPGDDEVDVNRQDVPLATRRANHFAFAIVACQAHLPKIFLFFRSANQPI